MGGLEREMKLFVISVGAIGLMVGIMLFLALGKGSIRPGRDVPTPTPSVPFFGEPTNFEECERTGGAIMESYPRICKTKEGESFIEEIEKPGATTSEDCKTAGCGDELCVEKESEQVYSICLFDPTHECYKYAVCEKQEDGKCGWTETKEFQTCMEEVKREGKR